MTTTQKQVENYLEKYRAADQRQRVTMRANSLFELLKWKEIRKAIRDIDMEAV